MRADAQGLFWTTPVKEKPERGRGSSKGGGERGGARVDVVRALPPVPDTGWVVPTGFPRLEAAKALSIDVETHDLGLAAGQGPGWAWEGGGEVIGLSVGTDDGQAWYFPIEGRIGEGLHRRGLPRAAIMAWAADELGRDRQPKIGANLVYDIGWLRREGVRVAGACHDVQYAEPLLDEHALSYSLATLAVKYGVAEAGPDGKPSKGPAEKALYSWLAAAYGGNAERGEQAGNIWRGPSELVGPYALGDTTLPFQILRKQLAALRGEGLLAVYDMERALIPLLVEMRWRGARVNVAKAQETSDRLAGEIERLRAAMGTGADPNSNVWLARAFDREGVRYPRTAPSKTYPEGQPSFKAEWLSEMAGKGVALAKQVLDVRRLEKAKGTFIDGYILGSHHGGRLHGEFHPLRSDSNGTISGRFSSSSPNLENIPSRDKEVKRWTRGCFEPEEAMRLFSPDQSQLEYRLMVHGAVGQGAEEARERYRTDPRTDYHRMVQLLIHDLTGRLIPRKPIKNVNFGKIFGMGEAKLMASLGMSQQEAHDFFVAYDKGVPFAKATLQHYSRMASRDGFIRTISGRKARFNTWEQGKRGRRAGGDGESWQRDLPWDQAVEKWGQQGLVRARTHKALNAYTQGGGGDIIKANMLAVWEGSGGAIVPHNTVHDELVFSIPHGCEGTEQARWILECMAGREGGNRVRDWGLTVPLVAAGKVGPNWADMAPMYFAGDAVTVCMPALGLRAGEKWAGEVVTTGDDGTEASGIVILATDGEGCQAELTGGWEMIE